MVKKYGGVGIVIDTDECAIFNAPCGSGTCENIPGNYTCQCLDGDHRHYCEAGKYHLFLLVDLLKAKAL